MKIATASDDGTTRIWDVGSGMEVLSLKDAMDKRVPVGRVAFSPSGTQVATASDNGTVRLWNIASHTGKVLRIVFSADGSQLATSDSEGTVRIWNADNRHLLGTLRTGLGEIYGLTFNADGNELLTANAEGKRTLWDLTDLTKIQPRFDLDKTGLQGTIDMTWSDGEDGRRLIAAGTSGVAEVWDPIKLKLLEPFGGPESAKAFALSANGRHLATITQKRDMDMDTLDIWNKGMTKNSRWSVNSDMNEKIKDVVLSPDGRYVASLSERGLIRVWDTSSKNSKEPFISLPPDYLTISVSVGYNSMAFSSDRLAVAYAKTVVVWDIAKKGNPTFIRVGEVTTLAFSPNGKRLAVASRDGTFRVLRLDAEDLIAQAQVLTKRLTLSPEECELYQVRRCTRPK